MVDRTSPDTRRAGHAAGRLLVAAGLVIAGLFVGTGVSAADDAPVVSASSDSVSSDSVSSDSVSSDSVSSTPAIDYLGSRIG
jgi:hypothetical protein